MRQVIHESHDGVEDMVYGIQDWYALFQMHLCLNTLDTAVLPNIDMSSL